jgi:hypothetical protein
MSESEEIIARECRFVIHVPTRSDELPDLHLIKEQLHLKDGTTRANLRFLKDYKRPFYITKSSCRYHKTKKEWEYLENLDKHECTQSQLRFRVAQALEKPWSKDSLKVLSQSPYLYGTDITSTALIKKSYMVKNTDHVSGYTTAFYDIETDVVRGTNEIIMATVVFQDKIFTSVVQSFVQNMPGIETIIQNKFDHYLSEYQDKYHFKLEVHVAKTPAQAVIACFQKANAWMPDFLAIWNMDFDIPRSVSELLKEGYDPAQELSHPSVPPAFRRYQYREGARKKVTASGRVIPINPSSQWHSVYLTASFYIIDAMCAYKLLRTPPAQEEPSYALDYILNKELKIGKLRFKEADQYTGLKWHEFMQSQYKAEYIIYNIFDCISLQELNNKTKDLSHSLPSFAGATDFEKYNSNPRKIHDALHFFCLERGLVISASGSLQKNTDEDLEIDFTEEVDKENEQEEYNTLDLKGWIVTLPAHLTEPQGLQVIEEDPQMRPNIRGFVYDSDSVSAYPSATDGLNVSKETTKKELSSIDGIDESTFRLQNMNLIYGPINAIEYCTNMFGFPNVLEIDNWIDELKK